MFCLALGFSLSSSFAYSNEPLIDLGPETVEHLRDYKPLSGDEETQVLDSLGLGSGNRFLYDAQAIGFDRTGQKYRFQGDVVLIGGASIITADVIEVDYPKKSLTARGHVIFLSGDQIFTGRRIKLQWDTGDFVIDDSVMVVNDPGRAKKQIEQVLGVGPEESVFKAAKSGHLSKLQADKLKLREQVLRLHLDGKALDQSIVDRYTLLLEQEILAKANDNPGLAKKSEKRRKSYLKRRKYWEESREKVGALSVKKKHYMKISGQQIERKNDHDFYANDAILTPCRCEDDETPAWGFRADRIKAQEEGYVDMM